jgi:hypothetical protein
MVELFQNIIIGAGVAIGFCVSLGLLIVVSFVLSACMDNKKLKGKIRKL